MKQILLHPQYLCYLITYIRSMRTLIDGKKLKVVKGWFCCFICKVNRFSKIFLFLNFQILNQWIKTTNITVALKFALKEIRYCN